MNDPLRQEIANFRFGLIASVVSRRELSRGETAHLLAEIARGKYEIPYSTRKTVSARTLQNYLKLYRKDGVEALKPPGRKRSSKIPAEYLQAAEILRRENRYRSISTIIDMLEKSGRVPVGVLRRSTVYDHFQKLGLTRLVPAPSREHYRNFSASYRGEILQGDVHHTLQLPDPSRQDTKRQVFLFAWLDDYSRFVPHAQFYWAERLPALEDCLKKAVIKHGIPESIYVDNGAVYSSHHLQTICSYLGIRLRHSRPYKPQGRGKVEKFFQLVESSFKHEASLLIAQSKINNLDDLNRYFFAWVDRFYNQKIHSSTKQAPLIRWQKSESPLRLKSLDEIHLAFLMEKQVSVSKTGVFRLENNEYEVEPGLAGRRISIRYDPYDLTSGIRVFFEDREFPEAIPAKVRRHHHKNYGPQLEEPAPLSGINHLELLNDEQLGLNFSDLEGLS